MNECMYQQNTSPEKGCYYENKNHSIMFMDCKTANCYYKQLKRLQVENEQLKEEIKRLNKPVFLPNIEQEATNKYRKALEEIREDLEQDTTCESRECGCDDYGECLKCVKETIIEICDEVLK